MKNKESSKLNNWDEKGIGKASNTLPNYLKWLSILGILLIILLFIPIKVLLAVDYKTDEYIKAWNISEDEVFTVLYTHSVQLTPVTETYKVEEKNIILTSSFFYSLGAGLPSTSPYKYRLRDEGFELYDINEELEYLVYRTGAERANHKLIFENKEYDFLDFSKPRAGVKFIIDDMSIILYAIKEVF